MAADEKLAWRRVLRARRDAIAVGERQTLSRRIGQHLLAEPAVASAQRVALYAPVGSEVATADVHAALAERGAQVLYPRVLPSVRHLDFAPCGDPTLLLPGPFAIPEPQGPALALAEIDVVVLPGLGFDRRGVRLGSGAGYYDRSLAAFAGVSVGIAFACQLVDQLPEAEGDRRVDMVVTERQVITFERPHAGGAAWPR